MANPEYGRGRHAIAEAAETAEDVTSSRIKERLLCLFRSPEYKPPLLPAVALELIELTRRRNVQVAEVTRCLSRDPMLAAQLLRLAASPLYSRSEPIRSLNDAVVRLGLGRTADLFVRAALEARLLKAPGYDAIMNTLRRHSAFTAEVARLVSRYAVGFEDYAFLCGLLHDVGVAAGVLALRDMPGAPLRPEPELVWLALSEIHAACSEAVAKMWALPPEIALVLGLHHSLGTDRHVHPLAAAVSLADHLAEEVGFGLFGEGSPSQTADVASQAGVAEPALAELRKNVAALANTFVA
ncbi:MAG TPA: HDOD domain-containing protein [Polyangiaceae bacterium]|nr:HDOD domain-containing protein [Polyangiaceae bacterium]